MEKRRDKIFGLVLIMLYFLSAIIAMTELNKYGGMENAAWYQKAMAFVHLFPLGLMYLKIASLIGIIPTCNESESTTEKEIEECGGGICVALLMLAICVAVDFLIIPAFINAASICIIWINQIRVARKHTYYYGNNKSYSLRISHSKSHDELSLCNIYGDIYGDTRRTLTPAPIDYTPLYTTIEELRENIHKATKEELAQYRNRMYELMPMTEVHDALTTIAVVEAWIEEAEKNQK